MADQAVRAGGEFTAAQLQAWVGNDITSDQRVHATSRLCALQFVRDRVAVVQDERVDVYTVTPDGEAAIHATRLGHVRKSGPKTTRKANPVLANAFTTRLWQLVRIRKVITPRQAAETLCDAGADDFERRRDTARKCLRRWANAGALAEGKQRVGAQGTSNGDKRYVLVKDSPQPPVWHKPKHAAKQSAKGGQP
ncbi:MAG: hypothetical protein Q8M96_22150 [Rubrivivax sp.]|nr:hypothetical protein [Rubrivivax sp.]